MQGEVRRRACIPREACVSEACYLEAIVGKAHVVEACFIEAIVGKARVVEACFI